MPFGKQKQKTRVIEVVFTKNFMQDKITGILWSKFEKIAKNLILKPQKNLSYFLNGKRITGKIRIMT